MLNTEESDVFKVTDIVIQSMVKESILNTAEF